MPFAGSYTLFSVPFTYPVPNTIIPLVSIDTPTAIPPATTSVLGITFACTVFNGNTPISDNSTFAVPWFSDFTVNGFAISI